MHEVHEGLLWVGHAIDIRQPKPLFDAGIVAVIDVAYEEPPAQLPRQLIYCRFPISDGGGNEPTVLRHALQTTVDFLISGTPTIIACSAGMSRSPSIAAFALACKLEQAPSEMIAAIGGIKSLEVNPVLWRDLEAVLPGLRGAGK